MSRRLPIVGASAKASDTIATFSISTLLIVQRPSIAVLGANSQMPIDPFVTALRDACQRQGMTVTVERTAELQPHTRLVVLIGHHVPPTQRHPMAQQLWSRADMLLAESSVVIAESLAVAV